MLEWLRLMSHPDGNICFFNDAAFYIAPTYNELKKYYVRLKLNKLIKTKKCENKYFRNSSFIVINNKHNYFVANVGKIIANHQPGHTHADINSFELSLFKKRFIVNSGVSTYEKGSQRLIERSSISHNNLVIDNINSNEVWESFRVAKRANLQFAEFKSEKDHYSITMQHQYNKNFFSKINQTRRIILKNNSIHIQDCINNLFSNRISRIYFHPEVKFINKNEGTLGNFCKIFVESENCKVKIKNSYWNETFYKKIRNQHLEFSFEDKNCLINIYWKKL